LGRSIRIGRLDLLCPSDVLSRALSLFPAPPFVHDFDHAFEWLNRAVDNHALSLGHKLTHDPILEPLRADPRYAALLREVRRSQ
jgi:hypothetical protein